MSFQYSSLRTEPSESLNQATRCMRLSDDVFEQDVSTWRSCRSTTETSRHELQSSLKPINLSVKMLAGEDFLWLRKDIGQENKGLDQSTSNAREMICPRRIEPEWVE